MAFKMKAGKEGPMRKNFGDAVTPMNFNAGLKAASKAGKLDNNPKFKAAVDKAPVKLKKDGVTTGTMDKLDKLKYLNKSTKRMVNKAKDIVKNNPEVLAIGPAGLAISKAIKKTKSKKNKEVKNQQGLQGGLNEGSPKKFIGKALGGALSGALGGGGGLPPGVSMGLGALGGLLNRKRKKGKGVAVRPAPMLLKETGGSVDAVDKKKQRKLKRKLKKLDREHNRDARKTEGSKLRQAIRRNFGKNRSKKS